MVVYIIYISLYIFWDLLNNLNLTLILKTWRIWWAPNNACRWQTGFNPACKGYNMRHKNETYNNKVSQQRYVTVVFDCDWRLVVEQLCVVLMSLMFHCTPLVRSCYLVGCSFSLVYVGYVIVIFPTFRRLTRCLHLQRDWVLLRRVRGASEQNCGPERYLAIFLILYFLVSLFCTMTN